METSINTDNENENKIIIKEDHNKNNIYIEEEEETNSKLLNLPDYLIENYIFPYLSWKELFFTVRGAHSYLHEIVKSTWCNIIKEEMCNQLKNLTFLYEKDALTKAYEFKFQYLINYRNLLLVYHLNADILSILQSSLDFIDDLNVFKLIATFFGILGQEQCLNVLFEDNTDNETKKTKIKELITSEIIVDDFKTKMEIILDINSIESDEQIFKELNDDFNTINREAVEEINDSCRLIYNFLQGILEYQSLKKVVQEIKRRLEQLYIKIQLETQQWPKRKKFFETAYKILLYSKSTTYKFQYMKKLYLIYDVKSPFCEYKEESYNSMVALRDEMETKKLEILQRLKNNERNDNTQNLMDEVNEILLKNVLDRRLLLTKKILLTEKFYDVIMESITKPNGEILSNGKALCIKGEIITFEELLKTLLLVSHASPEDISINSVLKLFKIKKNLEEVQLRENKDAKGLNEISKTEALNIEKKSEIILLKRQKENLINQKKKTEQMLNILKKYMQLKENFLKNRQKYKSILFVLSKIRKHNIQQNENEIGDNTMDKIEQLLDNQNLENIDLNMDEISSEEKDELKNFDVSDELLKDIECTLMLKIKKLFEEEKNQNIDDNNNEINDINSIEINKEELNIEKRDNIKIEGNNIKINNEEKDDKKE